MIKRRHWFVLFFEFFFVILLVIFLVAVVGGLNYNFQSFFNLVSKPLIILFFLIFLQTLLVIIFAILVDYYLDLWIVTNRRSIRIELKGLFNREITSIDHGRVQEITVKMRGVFPALLNYGDVYIQSAAETSFDFVFSQIPNPEDVKKILLRLTGKGGEL